MNQTTQTHCPSAALQLEQSGKCKNSVCGPCRRVTSWGHWGFEIVEQDRDRAAKQRPRCASSHILDLEGGGRAVSAGSKKTLMGDTQKVGNGHLHGADTCCTGIPNRVSPNVEAHASCRSRSRNEATVMAPPFSQLAATKVSAHFLFQPRQKNKKKKKKKKNEVRGAPHLLIYRGTVQRRETNRVNPSSLQANLRGSV